MAGILYTLTLCLAQAGGVELVPVINPGDHGREVSRSYLTAATTSPLESALCRIIAACPDGQSWGSGVLLEGGCVLTAAHVVRGASSVTVIFRDGVRVQGTVATKDDTYDLALVAAEPSAGAKGLKRSSRNVLPGDVVYTAGYGAPNEGLQWQRRQAVGYAGPAGATPDWLTLSGGSRQGDSGMPILTESAEVVGVVWGTDGAYSSGTNAGRTRLLCQYCCPPRGGRMVCPPQYQVMPCPPVVQMPQQVPQPIPLPVPQQPPTEPPKDISQEINDKLLDLQKQIDELKATPATCPPGKDGPPGPPGKDGADGKDATVDAAAIVASVVEALKADQTFISACKGQDGQNGKDAAFDPAVAAKALPPIRIQTLNLDGTVHQDVEARLGDLVKLKPVIVVQPK